MLKKNELNVTGVSKIAGILNEENKDKLLKEARCKSSRQIEALLARHKPEHKIRDRVRTVFIKTIQEAPGMTKVSRINERESGTKPGGDRNQLNSTNEN